MRAVTFVLLALLVSALAAADASALPVRHAAAFRRAAVPVLGRAVTRERFRGGFAPGGVAVEFNRLRAGAFLPAFNPGLNHALAREQFLAERFDPRFRASFDPRLGGYGSYNTTRFDPRFSAYNSVGFRAGGGYCPGPQIHFVAPQLIQFMAPPPPVVTTSATTTTSTQTDITISQ